MDEPTNHLDILSKDILKKALINFDGTLIIISHDRDFLQGLSNKIYEFKDKVIKEYMGDITTFLEAKEIHELDDLNMGKKEVLKTLKTDSNQKITYQKRKELDRSIRKTENRITKIEKEVTELTASQQELDLKLSNPESFKEMTKDSDFFKNYESQKDKIIKKEKEWEQLVSELNKLKKS